MKQLNEELETIVKERTQELQNSNQELQDLAYTIAHDLRSPLRAIYGFSALLADELGDQITGEVKRELGIIQTNTKKMDQLIEGLLTMVKLIRIKIRLSLIDMKQIIEEVISELTRDNHEVIKVKFGDLPSATGDESLLKEAWLQLIQNSIQFKKPKTPLVLIFKGYKVGDQVIYSLEDNGMGFNPTYSDKMFKLFHTLHTPKDGEGIGIGLAIVERIIKRHGGKVWVEGIEGQGATFYFSLPTKGQ